MKRILIVLALAGCAGSTSASTATIAPAPVSTGLPARNDGWFKSTDPETGREFHCLWRRGGLDNNYPAMWCYEPDPPVTKVALSGEGG